MQTEPTPVIGAGESVAAPRSESPPLLVSIGELSKLLRRSEASLHRDDAAGRLPAALRIGGSKRWRYGEIVAWVEAGMPERVDWQVLHPSGGPPQINGVNRG